jgi:hypothetical protein
VTVIEIQVTADLDILDAFEEVVQRAPGLAGTAYRRVVSRLGSRILAQLRQEPGPASDHYPLRWKSARQRRYVMAKLRQEGNLPYERTGRLLDSYEFNLIEDTSGGAIMEVRNTDPKAQFVVGDQVQPMFLDIGWIQVSDVISDARVEAEDVLIETWYTLTDPFAGIPA